MPTRVKNVPKSSKNSPHCKKCGPWIKHWENVSTDSHDDQCCAVSKDPQGKWKRCEETTEPDGPYGGHLYVDRQGQKQWIGPICAVHNGKDEKEWYFIDCVLVRARHLTPLQELEEMANDTGETNLGGTPPDRH